jgi:hypothetical protein
MYISFISSSQAAPPEMPMLATQPHQREFNDFNETVIIVTIETLDQLNQRLLQGRIGGGKKTRLLAISETAPQKPANGLDQNATNSMPGAAWLRWPAGAILLFGGLSGRNADKSTRQQMGWRSSSSKRF